MRKVNVLHLTSTPSGLGGVERLLLDMAPHYDFTRFRVAHCNLFDETGGSGPFPTALRSTGLPYFAIEGNRSVQLPKMVARLRSLIRRERVDVLHVHMLHATILGGLSTLAGHRAKVLVSKHYRSAMVNGPVRRLLDRLSTSRASAIAAVSHFVESDLLRLGTAQRKIRVIHNGIDLQLFARRASQQDHTIPDGPGPLLVCVGNLHPLKGHQYLLRAMPVILRDYPSARLVIAGEGVERGRLEELSKLLNITDAVLMPGFHGNVPALLSRADLCVHPSLDEAFGIALLEAMAARKASVATTVGGIPEIVDHKTTGLLVEPRDPNALARAVCSLLANRRRSERFGDAGRSRVEANFTIERTVRSYEGLYRELAC